MTQNGYLVQLHMHTSETSRCAKASGAEMARAAAAYGYHAIVITDHFFNANSVAREAGLSWEEMVRVMFAGYRAAKKEAETSGLLVLKGWETFNDGHEFLTYGLDEEFLLKNPDIATLDYRTYLERVYGAGAYVIQAHPFRKAAYIPPYTPDAGRVEFFETYNAGNDQPEFNEQAAAFVKRFHKIGVAGSDAHRTEELLDGQMRFFRPVASFDEIFAAIRAGEFVPVCLRPA